MGTCSSRKRFLWIPGLLSHPSEIQILRMGVLPENRREGLASEMLKELDQKAILNQSHTLWLDAR